MKKTARHRRRLLLGIAIALGVMLIASFAALHIIVEKKILCRWINTDPDEISVDYDSGSSWMPGVIRLRGLTMRGSDRNVQWQFRMESVRISYSPLALLRREFHATAVRAQGLVFRLRQRGEKKELTAARLSRIPEIPGFTDPPLRPTTPEPPLPTPADRRRFWTIYVENLIADPTPEIWVDLYRFRGHARVRGGFLLHPHDVARIGPATVTFLAGDIALGANDLLLRSASGEVDGAFDSYAPDEVNGDEIWPKISGKVELQGRLEDLSPVNYFLLKSLEPRFSGGSGNARISLRLDHGIASGGATIDAAGLRVAYAKATLTGKVSARLEIPRWDIEHGDMQVSGSRMDLSDFVTAGTMHDQRDWWGRFRIPTGRLHDGFQAHATVVARDARPLYTLFGLDLPGWAQGIMKLEGFNARSGLRLGRDLTEISGFDATGGKFHIAGKYREESNHTHTGTRKRGAFLVETGSLAVGISMDDSGNHIKLAGARKWFAETP